MYKKIYFLTFSAFLDDREARNSLPTASAWRKASVKCPAVKSLVARRSKDI